MYKINQKLKLTLVFPLSLSFPYLLGIGLVRIVILVILQRV